MLTETDFSQIQDYFLQKLPQWLRQSPEIATAIESLVAQQFPRRDDFARLLEEMKALRQEVSFSRSHALRGNAAETLGVVHRKGMQSVLDRH